MEQLAISVDDKVASTGARRRSLAGKRPAVAVAEKDPVAEVLVDINAASVDHSFDYLVPAELDERVLRGCRVRVRFAGRLVNGFVLSRRQDSEHSGRLALINRVLGPVVLIEEIGVLARSVADRYAGTANEILRDAVPPRHAKSELKFVDEDGLLVRHASPGLVGHAVKTTIDWHAYEGGHELITALGAREQARATVVTALADSGPQLVADLVSCAGGHAIVVVPDASEVQRFAAILEDRFGENVTRLTGEQKPGERYGAFLRIRVGQSTIVVGTRNCVFAPVDQLRLVVVWDDGDESLAEVRAPGWHAREVAALRSLETDVSFVVAGYAQSIEAARMAEQGWLTTVVPGRVVRRLAPRIVTSASSRADDPAARSRIPRFAWEAISQGIVTGPVLVQVGRAGYLPALSCQECRTVAMCPKCRGPMGQRSRDAGYQCRWCGHLINDLACTECGGRKFRAVRIGSERTAEELRASFPQIPVVVSDSVNGVLTSVGNSPQIVVATVGAEPHAASKYAAAVLLDGDAQLIGAHLRSEEQLVRRWFNATALVRGSAEHGVVAVTADASHRAVQALVRSDPSGWAVRELSERKATGLPPVSRCVAINGPSSAVLEFLKSCQADPAWRTLGPSPVDGSGRTPAHVRAVILAPGRDGPKLAHAVKEALISGAGGTGPSRVVVRMDPPTVL